MAALVLGGCHLPGSGAIESAYTAGTTACQRSPVRAQGCGPIYVCGSTTSRLVWYTAGNEPDTICEDASDRQCMNASFADAFGYSCRNARGVR